MKKSECTEINIDIAMAFRKNRRAHRLLGIRRAACGIMVVLDKVYRFQIMKSNKFN